MNRILVVCFVGLVLPTYSAQSAPPLQRGISVEMPVTVNAAPMPEADREDALIVTVSRHGRVYVGVRGLDPNSVGAELQTILSRTPLKTVYIKADARAPYAMVISVLDAATAAGSERTILLTAQRGQASPGTVVSPEGFTVMNNRPRLSL